MHCVKDNNNNIRWCLTFQQLSHVLDEVTALSSSKVIKGRVIGTMTHARQTYMYCNEMPCTMPFGDEMSEPCAYNVAQNPVILISLACGQPGRLQKQSRHKTNIPQGRQGIGSLAL